MEDYPNVLFYYYNTYIARSIPYGDIIPSVNQYQRYLVPIITQAPIDNEEDEDFDVDQFFDFSKPHLTTLNENPEIDLTIDGADEVDSRLNLIKGGGGALTREKIIAYYSKKEIIVIDDSKVVKILGIDFPLPVEVVKYGWASTKKTLEKFGCNVELRKIMDEPFITDNSNYILDCEFERIEEPEQLEKEINNIPGVVENGLFIDLVDEVIVGSKQGIMTLEKEVFS